MQVKLTIEHEGNRVEITPAPAVPAAGADALDAHPVATFDWSRLQKVAACTVACLLAPVREEVKEEVKPAGGQHGNRRG